MIPTPTNTAPKQRSGCFVKGDPRVNRNGRPKGALNKTTIIAQQMFDAEAPELARIVIEMAKAGDKDMLKLVFDKLIPRATAPLDVTVKTERAIDITGMTYEQLDLMERSIMLMEQAEALGGPAAERVEDAR